MLAAVLPVDAVEGRCLERRCLERRHRVLLSKGNVLMVQSLAKQFEAGTSVTQRNLACRSRRRMYLEKEVYLGDCEDDHLRHNHRCKPYANIRVEVILKEDACRWMEV